MTTNLIGVAIKLNIERTVNTLEGVNLAEPYYAEYTAKITIEAKIGSIFINTST
jgi:hypothetical protein